MVMVVNHAKFTTTITNGFPLFFYSRVSDLITARHGVIEIEYFMIELCYPFPKTLKKCVKNNNSHTNDYFDKSSLQRLQNQTFIMIFAYWNKMSPCPCFEISTKETTIILGGKVLEKQI